MSKRDSKRDAQVPAFLSHTHNMVSDPQSDHIICWTRNGTAFQVHDPIELARDVLPRHFKHNNFSSFIRQLNMYGITKFGTNNVWLFGHEHFLQNQPELLVNIKRKASSGSSKSKKDSTALGESIVPEASASDDMKGMVGLLNQQKKALALELAKLQDSQRGLENRMTSVQNMNGQLWKELVQAKQDQAIMRENICKITAFLRSACEAPNASQRPAAVPSSQSPTSMTSAMLGSPMPSYQTATTTTASATPITKTEESLTVETAASPMGTAQPLDTPTAASTAKRSADIAGLATQGGERKRSSLGNTQSNDESVVPTFETAADSPVPDTDSSVQAPPQDVPEEPPSTQPSTAEFSYTDFFSEEVLAQKQAMFGENDESVFSAVDANPFDLSVPIGDDLGQEVPDFE